MSELLLAPLSGIFNSAFLLSTEFLTGFLIGVMFVLLASILGMFGES